MRYVSLIQESMNLKKESENGAQMKKVGDILQDFRNKVKSHSIDAYEAWELREELKAACPNSTVRNEINHITDSVLRTNGYLEAVRKINRYFSGITNDEVPDVVKLHNIRIEIL